MSESPTKEDLLREIESLRCIMYASYIEIMEHWDSHASEGGYGPMSLMEHLKDRRPFTENPYPQHLKNINTTKD